ncbi:MAG: methyltransferase domain-containing protein [Theionarchaea archaeon]|nr:methyltransferase domain-containing protein [Theionarchaea archaeon]
MAYNRKDGYWRKAKKEGYRSRASYKLLQINKKFHLIKKNDYVLDIGCAPGGWMQVAQKIVGPQGFVLGVDIHRIRPFDADNTDVLSMDITDPQAVDRIKNHIDSFDTVISDVSPNISGIWDVDHYNSIELSTKAFHIAQRTLRPKGNFVVKIFQGELIHEFYTTVKKAFGYTKITSPQASRKSSAETYIIGKYFNGMRTE